MPGAKDRAGQRCRGTDCAALGPIAVLAACAPVSNPIAGLPVEVSAALNEQVQPSNVALETIAETFALGGRATDYQRDNIRNELIGQRVEWDIPVYEVPDTDGCAEVTMQPIPVRDAQAAPRDRIVAYVTKQGDSDDALWPAGKTVDVIRIRSIVQKIGLRTIVAVVPEALVPGSDPLAPSH